MSEVFEIPNGAAQRDLIVGEWLVIPDLASSGHHTVSPGETWEQLAQRWYGEVRLWPIIAIANHMVDQDPQPGQVLIQPRLNRQHTVVAGDTLRKLVNDSYGGYGDARTRTLVALVAAANHIAVPNQIEVGQVIYLPSPGCPICENVGAVFAFGRLHHQRAYRKPMVGSGAPCVS